MRIIGEGCDFFEKIEKKSHKNTIIQLFFCYFERKSHKKPKNASSVHYR